MSNRIKKEQSEAGFTAEFYVNFRLYSCLHMEWANCKRLRNRFREFMAVNTVHARIKLL